MAPHVSHPMHRPPWRSLEISYFKSALDGELLDLLWNKYWVNTLSSNPLLATRDLVTGQLVDIGE
jgi:COP9 signalosome complex subunit 5